MISPQIDTQSATNVLLEFKHYIDDYNGDYSLHLETTSDGSSWNTVMTIPSEEMEATNESIAINTVDVGSATFNLPLYLMVIRIILTTGILIM